MKHRKLTICPHVNGVLTMDENGNIKFFMSPEHVVAAVRRRDTRAAKRGQDTTTKIEWRGCGPAASKG